jgi:FMN phosphatase YigB (HAD superfamily)
MIKNIIFDLGNVLIKYTPENFLENNVKKERQEKFIETVFKSKEWLDLDKGTLSYENAIEKFAEIIPEERENLEKLFKNNIMESLKKMPEETSRKELDIVPYMKKTNNIYDNGDYYIVTASRESGKSIKIIFEPYLTK